MISACAMRGPVVLIRSRKQAELYDKFSDPILEGFIAHFAIRMRCASRHANIVNILFIRVPVEKSGSYLYSITRCLLFNHGSLLSCGPPQTGSPWLVDAGFC
jgi:hypothetical protein